MSTSKIAVLFPFLLAACATARRLPPAAPVPPAPATAPVAAAPEPPGYRGRVTTSVGAGTTVWTDVVVAGTTEAHQRACAGALRGQQWQHESVSGVAAQVARACSLDPLPAPPAGVAYVLVDPEDPAMVSGAGVFASAIAGRPEAIEPVDTTVDVTHYWSVASEAACEQERARRLARREQQRVEASASAKQWLADELARTEKQRDQACQQQRELDTRCATLSGTRAPDVRRACKKDPYSDRCAEAQEKVSELEGCALFPREMARSCAKAEELVKVMREHVPEPPRSPAVPPPSCRTSAAR